jgi:hypothetical protein
MTRGVSWKPVVAESMGPEVPEGHLHSGDSMETEESLHVSEAFFNQESGDGALGNFEYVSPLVASQSIRQSVLSKIFDLIEFVNCARSSEDLAGLDDGFAWEENEDEVEEEEEEDSTTEEEEEEKKKNNGIPPPRFGWGSTAVGAVAGVGAVGAVAGVTAAKVKDNGNEEESPDSDSSPDNNSKDENDNAEEEADNNEASSPPPLGAEGAAAKTGSGLTANTIATAGVALGAVAIIGL